VTTGVIILEPWKGPGYTRRNTRFVVDPRGELEARVIHPVVVEDPVSEPREEGECQPEVLENEYFEDMASPYGGGGGERGVRRFSGAVGTIEVDDFKREFTM
jgi:hypothetical protein